MEYNFREIEEKWRNFWAAHKTYHAEPDASKPKYYVLDMFPYPSGAGLHVGHPLGYIASDIFARYKRLRGYNVLHPMGYDSFGLPAEQYAIQTGQHPATTTRDNIARYRQQLDNIGFSFDWDREVRTSSPGYYKWTQWIFTELFNAWYNRDSDRAEPVSELVERFKKEGNQHVNAASDYAEVFTADRWNELDEKAQEAILQEYRLTYLADSWVNWCPALGTVLANDEVSNGRSVRGGHPVEQKRMRQWSMRIKAYAERLLNGLETLDWSDSIRDQQRNWIGKSVGSSVHFQLAGHDAQIEVFTTRPDTIFGVSFMVLAPEHALVDEITTGEYREAVANYKKQASLKSERDRQADVKNITGQFTGAYALHPFSGEKIPVWIGDYVLAGYGTGAVMAVPCGDQRDWDFAMHFGLPIKTIFKDADISQGACSEKDAVITHSDFLDNLSVPEAMQRAIREIEARGIGKGKTNYRLRDAVFSRQRYWGEPFPVYYQDSIPRMIPLEHLPVELPEVDQYLPTEAGDPPLGNAAKWAWDTASNTVVANEKIDHQVVFPLELNTMPGWAGSSWYFVRYADPKNDAAPASEEALAYWQNVDLYLGGSEHATGHLLYARFWTKFLFDRGYLPYDEPFKKMINQGMILGRSSFVYRLEDSDTYISKNMIEGHDVQAIHVDVSLVDDDDVLNVEAFKEWRAEFADAKFILDNEGHYVCGHEIEKMSKSKYNVRNPDELVEKFGADTLRMYEMFLGPLEQSKPWDTKGISGVHSFLRKFWRLFHDEENNLNVSDGPASKESMKTLHKTIKKIEEDLDRFSFNTGVSAFMICVNELQDQRCNNRSVLEPLVTLIAPYAPHMAEELWEKLGHDPGTAGIASFPQFDEAHLVENSYSYPVSFNGKMRFKAELPLSLSPKEVESEVLQMEDAQRWLEGKAPKKVIVVPGKIVNVVF